MTKQASIVQVDRSSKNEAQISWFLQEKNLLRKKQVNLIKNTRNRYAGVYKSVNFDKSTRLESVSDTFQFHPGSKDKTQPNTTILTDDGSQGRENVLDKFQLFSQQEKRRNPYLMKPPKPTPYDKDKLYGFKNISKRVNPLISLNFSQRNSTDTTYMLPDVKTVKSQFQSKRI